MDKFVKVLSLVDEKSILDEVKNERVKTSKYLNNILLSNYPSFDSGNGVNASSIKLLSKIYDAELFKREYPVEKWNELLPYIDKIVKALYSNGNSIETNLRVFRKSIRDKYGSESELYKQSIYQTGISQEESIKKRMDYAKKVHERNINRGQLQPLYVSDILKIIQKYKNSNDPYERAIVLLLATGSRPIELFSVSDYKKIRGKPNKVMIIGLAKEKNPDGTLRQIPRYVVGLTSDEVVQMVKDLRSDITYLDRDITTISNRIHVPLNKAFDNLIQPLTPDNRMTAANTRFISGNLAYMIYGKPANIPYETFLQQNYGHISPESTKSYLGINIKVKPTKKTSEEYKEAVNEIEEKSEFNEFKNSNVRITTEAEKIANVIGAIKKMKAEKKNYTQKELRGLLGYSGNIMSKAYKLYKAEITKPSQ